MEPGKPLTPKPLPLDQNGYTEDLSTSPHIQASVEKALDNREVPATLSGVLSALSALNTKVATTNSILADIKKILDDHFNPPAGS